MKMFELIHHKILLGIFALFIYVTLVNGAMRFTVIQELTMDGFQFSCTLTSGSITTTTRFQDPNGATLGACSSSGSCASGTSPQCNIIQDLSSRVSTVTVPAGYVFANPTLSGNWTCIHSSDTGYVTYDKILAFESPTGVGVSFTIKGDKAEISFTMNCIYPSAIYTIEYKEEPGGNLLKTFDISSTDSRCTNITANCTTSDSRAYGQQCTVLEKLKKNYKISVSVKVTGSVLSSSIQNVTSSEIVLLGITSTEMPTTEMSSSEASTSASNQITSDSTSGSTLSSDIPRTTWSTAKPDFPEEEVILIFSLLGAFCLIILVVIVVVIYCVVSRKRANIKKRRNGADNNEKYQKNKNSTQQSQRSENQAQKRYALRKPDDRASDNQKQMHNSSYGKTTAEHYHTVDNVSPRKNLYPSLPMQQVYYTNPGYHSEMDPHYHKYKYHY